MLDNIGLMLLGAAIFIFLQSAARAYVRGWRKARDRDSATRPAMPDSDFRDLADHGVRNWLGDRLEHFMVIGDANIRDGKVCPVVPPKQLDEIVRRMRIKLNGLRERREMGNMLGTDLYYRVVDGAIGMTDIQLTDLEHVVGICERVVEDRKRSRSLYKGLSDDEMTAMIRVALCSFYDLLDPDFFSEAEASREAVKRGDMDGSELAKFARVLILQIFEIKGANE